MDDRKGRVKTRTRTGLLVAGRAAGGVSGWRDQGLRSRIGRFNPFDTDGSGFRLKAYDEQLSAPRNGQRLAGLGRGRPGLWTGQSG